MKLLILDQLQWVNFAACTQRPVMITGEVSHGIPLHVSCVQNSNLFLKWGGGVSRWVLWGRTVLGVMPPVHVQGPVCPDHVAASAWLPVSWLCRFGCPPVQWCPVGRSPPCVGSIPEQWMITPNTPGTVLPLTYFVQLLL